MPLDVPIFVRLLGPGAVEVRGAARLGGAGTEVQVQARAGSGRFQDLGRPITVRNAAGYFIARLRVANAATRTFRFTAEGHRSPGLRPVLRPPTS